MNIWKKIVKCDECLKSIQEQETEKILQSSHEHFQFFNEIKIPCSHCEELFLIDDEMIEHENKKYCDECFDELFFRCEHCDEIFSKDDECFSEHQEKSFCSDCYNEQVHFCRHCENEINPDEEHHHNYSHYCEECFHECVLLSESSEASIISLFVYGNLSQPGRHAKWLLF